LLVLAVVFAGFKAGQYLGTTAPGQPAVIAPRTSESAQASQQPQQSRAAAATGEAGKQSQSEPAADRIAEARKDQSPELIQPPPIPGHPSYWPVAAVGLLMLMAAGWYFTRPRDLVIKDSPDFEKALKIWHPLIYSRAATPRSIKRFMNRVRYLAMRQRSHIESEPRWQEIRAATGDFFGRTAEPPPIKKHAVIPEPALVALAAIQHSNHEWMEGDDEFKNIESMNFHQLENQPRPGMIDLLETAIAKHTKEFGGGRWETAAGSRKAFLEMSAGIQVN
jgi:hypothetical protein